MKITVDTPYILYLGRVIQEKGVHTLISAVNQLSVPVVLVIAGFSGNSLYEEYIRAHRQQNFVFKNVVTGAEKLALISNAKALVLPSMVEGLSKVILEAMALKTVVITNDIPPNKELITHGETGFLYHETADNLAKLLVQVLNKDTSEVENKAYDMVCKKYNSNDTIKEIMTMYNDMNITRGEKV